MVELFDWTRFTHFLQYLIASCSRLEAASVVISGRFVGLTVPDKGVKFRFPRLNSSGEIRPKAVGRFSDFGKRRLEVVGDIIPRAALVYVSMDVFAKFGDSVLNGGRII